MTHFAVLEFEGLLHVWADTRIAAGDDWSQRIQNAMDDSRVAVLLVSPHFLASKFIKNEEVPRLLQLHADNGMLILPLIARPCAWKLIPWLSRTEVRPKSRKSLSMSNDNESDADLADFTYEVASLLNRFTLQQSTLAVSAFNKLDDVFKAIQEANHVVNDRVVKSILVLAIEHGAPIYNEGLLMDCVHVYRYAAHCLLELIHIGKSKSTPTEFVPSVKEAEYILSNIIPAEEAITDENANELAWKLRKAFDQILEVAQRNPTRHST